MADHNHIEELAPNMFSDLVNLTVVNLTMNKLQTFPLSTLKLSKSKYIFLTISQLNSVYRQNSRRKSGLVPSRFPKVRFS